MAECATRLIGPGHPFPLERIDRALELFRDLSSSEAAPVLLHGDLHPDNILAADREPWLAIDPKGVIGEPAWEAGPLLMNILPSPPDPRVMRSILTRTVDQLAHELKMDRARLAACAMVRLVLSAFWTVEDHGHEHDWEDVIIAAQILEDMTG
jgi:streptomycin 6-kinase